MPPSTAPNAAPPLALTMGDPAGIGLEIAAKAWLAREERSLRPFLLYADVAALEMRCRHLGLDVPTAPVQTEAEAAAAFKSRLPVRHVALAAEARPGHPDAANAPAVIAAIEEAVAATLAGRTAAVVTNSIAKAVLYGAGFAHPGHTEFLAHLARLARPGTPVHAVMMLVSAELKVVPLTVHVPLADVPGLVSRTLIVDTARVTAAALRADFAIPAPRIAVTGLNPHAGENGAMGREETDIIAPAIAALRAEGLAITGPHPADTLFHARAREGYDAVIAMYHDQALIPLKTLAFDTGVNVTLGLPFVRTSPDHGTAFDIAADGRASPSSLIEAMKLAATMARSRAAAPA